MEGRLLTAPSQTLESFLVFWQRQADQKRANWLTLLKPWRAFLYSGSLSRNTQYESAHIRHTPTGVAGTQYHPYDDGPLWSRFTWPPTRGDEYTRCCVFTVGQRGQLALFHNGG